MVKMKITEADPKSYAIVNGILMDLVLLVVLLFISLIMGILITTADSEYVLAAVGGLIGMIVLFVIIMALVFAWYYLYAVVYNYLTNYIKPIEIDLENNRLKEINVMDTSVILSVISAIVGFVVSVIIGLLFFVITLASDSVSVASSIMIALLIVVLTTVIVFVASFIGLLITITIYNLLAEKNATKLEIVQTDGFFEIKSVDLESFVLSYGVCLAAIAFVQGLFAVNTDGGIGLLITNVIIAIVTVLIEGVIYNIIADKITGFKFKATSNVVPQNNEFVPPVVEEHYFNNQENVNNNQENVNNNQNPQNNFTAEETMDFIPKENNIESNIEEKVDFKKDNE